MNRSGKITSGLIVLLILIFIITSIRKSPAGSDAIKVGVIAPFSGNAATYGEQVKKGMDIALKEIGDQNRQKVDLIYEDNQFDPKLGLSAYNKLVKVDDVKYLISFGGNVCPIVNPLAQKDEIVNFATGCNTLDFKDDFSYNFRFDVSEAAASKALMDYAKDSLKTKELALLYVNDDWGTIVAQTIKNAAQSDGITIVSEETFDEQSRDVHTQLAKIKSTSPDSIFFISLVNFTPAILKQIHDSGISAHLLTNISIEGADSSALGSVAEGVIYSAPKPAHAANTRNDPFDAAFPDPDSRNFASWGFDSVNLLSDALDVKGDDPRAVAEYLHGIKDYAGAFGVIHYDDHGELQLDYQIKTVKAGKFAEIK